MSDIGFDEQEELRNSVTKLPTLVGIKRKFTTREGWIGDFDFANLCMPTLNPWSAKRTARSREVPFYGLNDNLPILLALVCGFQHSLSMLAGVITPPIIFASSLNLPTETQVYMVAASLICSGLLSALQMTRFKLPFTRNIYFGTGLITVVGTSFASLSTASSIFNALYADGTCPLVRAADGTMIKGACPEAFGYLLGTSALCSLLEMGMAFVPPRVLKKIFPPIITGTVIMLIGAKLIKDSGFVNWAGGSNACRNRPTTGIFVLCPSISAPHALKWGSAEYLGLGFLSFVTILIVELFGSPFMKNASIIMGLIVGMIVAGPAGYVSGASIKSAPAITFLWTTTFPLKIYAPAILPMLTVYIVLAMEAMGDITASSEASRQPVKGLLYDSRVQGGILADGFNCLLSTLMTNTPMSIFAQNNGVISITRCANKTAGYVCAALLVLYGVLAKISGVFLAIPNSVLGGVTTFLFATVFVSGLKVISFAEMTRRNRIVLASSLSLGLGSLLVPDYANYMFTYGGNNAALKGFFNSIVIILSTPFLISTFVGVIMNLILPAEPDIVNDAEANVELMEQHTLPRRAESDTEEGYSKEDKRDPMAV